MQEIRIYIEKKELYTKNKEKFIQKKNNSYRKCIQKIQGTIIEKRNIYIEKTIYIEK